MDFTDMQTWIDLLPVETTEKIARLATKGAQDCWVCDLTEVSENFWRAILSALNHKLSMVTTKELGARWLKAYANKAREIVFYGGDLDKSYLLRQAVKSPHCKKVTIIVLEVCFLSSEVVEKMVDVWETKQVTLDIDVARISAKEFLKVIRTCKPHSVSVHCSLHIRRILHEFFEELLQEAPSLGIIFESVRTMDMEGLLYGNYTAMWSEILKNLPSVRKVKLVGKECLNADWIHTLRNRESVIIDGAESNITEIMQIGKSVTEISLSTKTTSNSPTVYELKHLPEAFPGLQRLAVQVMEGRETEFFLTLSQLPHLQALGLTWCRRGTDRSGYAIRAQSFVVLASGSVLNIVKACPKLQELKLCGVDVSEEEISQIVQTLGEKLQALYFTVETINAENWNKIRALVVAIIRHCPNISSLEVTTRSCCSFHGSLLGDIDVLDNINMIDDADGRTFYLKTLLKRHLERLHDSAPGLPEYKYLSPLTRAFLGA